MIPKIFVIMAWIMVIGVQGHKNPVLPFAKDYIVGNDKTLCPQRAVIRNKEDCKEAAWQFGTHLEILDESDVMSQTLMGGCSTDSGTLYFNNVNYGVSETGESKPICYRIKDTWKEEIKDKFCTDNFTEYIFNSLSSLNDYKDYAKLQNQIRCQEECLKNVACVGISYSPKDYLDNKCYVCTDDILSTSPAGFGFYRRPECEESRHCPRDRPLCDLDNHVCTVTPVCPPTCKCKSGRTHNVDKNGNCNYWCLKYCDDSNLHKETGVDCRGCAVGVQTTESPSTEQPDITTLQPEETEEALEKKAKDEMTQTISTVNATSEENKVQIENIWNIINAKVSKGSNFLPNSPGCWIKYPSGCPNKANEARYKLRQNKSTWNRENYLGASDSREKCFAREGPINRWCGVNDIIVVYV